MKIANNGHICERPKMKEEKMGKLEELIVSLPDETKLKDFNVYPDSINQIKDSCFMIKKRKQIILLSEMQQALFRKFL